MVYSQENIMQKILFIVLLLVSILGVTGCYNNQDDGNGHDHGSHSH